MLTLHDQRDARGIRYALVTVWVFVVLARVVGEDWVRGNFAWMGLPLWYLLALFIFPIIPLPLSIPDPLKFVIVGVSVFTIVVGLYELIVKRGGVLRFLFGMKPLRRADVRSGAALAAQR